jgi:hypothetical protein
MADEIKRLHYFDHQFLRAADFTDEQEYHLQMRRRHQRVLHTAGIAEGLVLSFASGASRATLSAGAAVDGSGREIVLAANTQTVDLSGFGGKTVYVTISHDEQETDPTSETGVTGNTRWTESPLVGVTESPPSDPSRDLIVGRVTVGADGKITATDDGVEPNRRRSAGAVGGDLEVRGLALTDPGVAPSQWPRMRLGAPSTAALQGDLHVSGDVDTTGTVDGRDVSADGTALDGHLGRTDNPHGTTAAQVGAPTSVSGVHNAGGDIGVFVTDAISISADNAAARITIGETHSALQSNPHGVTAAQTGALPTTGGAIQGDLSVTGSVGFSNATTPMLYIFESGTANPDRPIIAHSPAFPTYGLAYSDPADKMIFQSNAVPVMVVDLGSRFVGIGNIAPAAQLHVVGNVEIDGNLRVLGNKGNYVTDTFVNASGGELRTGDVVRLHPDGVARFHGRGNMIPVPRVALADSENDPRVIGVVCGEAAPDPDEPDRRTEPEDPTVVPDGGDVLVVTLGSFAHCKVDATGAPIGVGDLLTPSGNPGHARKAVDPTVGSVIGKALEPLQEGTGHIAVFVNIQ